MFTSFWIDKVDFFAKNVKGWRVFCRSPIYTLMLIGGYRDDLLFSFFNIVLLFSGQLIIFSPFFAFNKGRLRSSAILIITFCFVMSIFVGFLFVSQRYEIKYGYWLCTFSLAQIVIGLIAYKKKSF